VGRSFGGIAAHHAEGKAVTFSISVFLSCIEFAFVPIALIGVAVLELLSIGRFHRLMLSKDRLQSRWERAMLKVSPGCISSSPGITSARLCSLAMPPYFTASQAFLTGLSAVRSIHKLLGPVVGRKTGGAEVDKQRFVLPVQSAGPNGTQRRPSYSVNNGPLSA
jgi:hypothetical protein